jgi:hypothetical protein
MRVSLNSSHHTTIRFLTKDCFQKEIVYIVGEDKQMNSFFVVICPFLSAYSLLCGCSLLSSIKDPILRSRPFSTQVSINKNNPGLPI